ncbi:MAG: GNAT family N-acetyltransferase [Saprospiraceae bacterium]
MLIQADTKHTKYRDFARSQVDMPVYSKDWYLDAVHGDEWEVITVERNGKIVASLPYVSKKKYIFEYIYQHPFLQTMGPFIRPDFRNLNQEMKLMKELIQQLPKMDGFEQYFHYSIQSWTPFYWAGYSQTTRYTYVLDDISHLDTVWQNFSSKYRNKIRKAKANIEIIHDRTLEDFHKASMLTFQRQNLKHPYSFEFLQQFDNRLEQEKRKKIFFAQDKNGQIHSVLYLTFSDDTAHLHLAGENPELRNSGAGIYLIWEAIRYASKERKLQKFDFQGSMLQSVERVRRDCGAEPKPYHRVWKYDSRFLRWWKKK